jgi:hypothetical protein
MIIYVHLTGNPTLSFLLLHSPFYTFSLSQLSYLPLASTNLANQFPRFSLSLIFRARKFQEATIFFFDKKSADKVHKPRRKEMVTEVLKRGFKQLEKHQQHCQILQIYHPLEETVDSLAFACEPLFGSLANIFAYLQDKLKQDIPATLREYTFLEFEVKYGLLQVSQPGQKNFSLSLFIHHAPSSSSSSISPRHHHHHHSSPHPLPIHDEHSYSGRFFIFSSSPLAFNSYLSWEMLLLYLTR